MRPNKTHLKSMRISIERLSQFIKLFERKTGKKLSEPEALARAETLLRTVSVLYQPVNVRDYGLALAKKMALKISKLKIC